jgi:hypothetical protein
VSSADIYLHHLWQIVCTEKSMERKRVLQRGLSAQDSFGSYGLERFPRPLQQHFFLFVFIVPGLTLLQEIV